MGACPHLCCFAVCLRPLLEVNGGGCLPPFVSLCCVLAFTVCRGWWWALAPIHHTLLCVPILCWWGMVGRVTSFRGTVVPCPHGCVCWWVLLGVLGREGARCCAQSVIVICGWWWWVLVDGDGVLVAVC